VGFSAREDAAVSVALLGISWNAVRWRSRSTRLLSVGVFRLVIVSVWKRSGRGMRCVCVCVCRRGEELATDGLLRDTAGEKKGAGEKGERE
jgi:hypothetical protein